MSKGEECLVYLGSLQKPINFKMVIALSLRRATFHRNYAWQFWVSISSKL
jgi:hypothetical protein